MNLGKKSRAGLSQLHLQTTSLWQPAGCLKTGAVDASLQKAHRCCSECQREETLKKKEFCCLLPRTEWAPPFPSHSLPAVISSHALATGLQGTSPCCRQQSCSLGSLAAPARACQWGSHFRNHYLRAQTGRQGIKIDNTRHSMIPPGYSGYKLDSQRLFLAMTIFLC